MDEEQQATGPKRHGGARAGAGRKPKVPHRPGQVYLDPDVLAIVDHQRGDMSRKAYVAELIRRTFSI